MDEFLDASLGASVIPSQSLLLGGSSILKYVLGVKYLQSSYCDSYYY